MLAPVTEATSATRPARREPRRRARAGRAFAAQLEEVTGLPTGYRENGALVVAADRDDAEELRRLHAFQRSLGLDAEWLSPRAAGELEPALSPRVRGGILAPQEARPTRARWPRPCVPRPGELALGRRSSRSSTTASRGHRRAHRRRHRRLRPGRGGGGRLERRARPGRRRAARSAGQGPDPRAARRGGAPEPSANVAHAALLPVASRRRPGGARAPPWRSRASTPP